MKLNLKVFNIIYKYNLWLFGSGSGSLAINNKPYIKFLNNFISKNNINNILDIGCGDWQLFENINLNNNINYLGIDIVENIIKNNKKKYENQNINFKLMDYNNFNHNNYKTDLIIIKDVLQHLNNKDIKKFIEKTLEIDTKFILIINDHSKMNLNIDVNNGLYRPININNEPFNYNFKTIFKYYEKIYLILYILSLIIILILILKKRYYLYYFSLIFLIIYGIYVLPKKHILLFKKKKN